MLMNFFIKIVNATAQNYLRGQQEMEVAAITKKSPSSESGPGICPAGAATLQAWYCKLGQLLMGTNAEDQFHSKTAYQINIIQNVGSL